MISLQKEISSLTKVIEKLYQGSIGKVKATPATRAQKSPCPHSNTTCISVIDIHGDSQPSRHLPDTDLTDSSSDSPCSPSTPLLRVSTHTASDPALGFSQSCPDISQDKITGSLSSSMCQHIDPVQIMVLADNDPGTSLSHCSGYIPGSCSNCVSQEELTSILHRVEVLEKALQDITTLCPNDPVPTDVLNQSSHHKGYRATNSIHGSVPKNSQSNGSGQQSPVSPLAEVHFNPIDSGYQSLLASPLSETKPHLVASSPIPID